MAAIAGITGTTGDTGDTRPGRGPDEIALGAAEAPAALWDRAAAEIAGWLGARGLAARDAIVLLPFARLLAPLREALAARGGWPPRVETALTLAAALALPPPLPADTCCGDELLDGLVVTRRLRREGWARAWAARDRAGFALLVARAQEAVATLLQAAAARPPAVRGDWWREVEARIAARGGPASLRADDEAPPTVVEDRLLAIACELAQQGARAAPPATDALFALRPAAWIAVRLGGADELAEALLAHGGAPALRLRADPPEADPFGAAPSASPPPWAVRQLQRLVADDAEAEARAAAGAVIEALQAGRAPVALVALDRLRTRRVRALLARAGVPMLDETGWRVATSAAATRVRARLAAALGASPARSSAAAESMADAPPAAPDAVLAWLKAWPPARDQPVALQSLEAQWRRRRRVPDEAAGRRLWRQASEWLAAWQPSATPRALRDWLALLADQMQCDGTWAELQADAAGRRLVDWLRLDQVIGEGVDPDASAHADPHADPHANPESDPDSDADHGAWQRAIATHALDLPGFIAWFDAALDGATFDPPGDAAPVVVLTPLARAIGRPFGAVVVPGADHEHLGSVPVRAALIDDRLAAALGLEDRAGARRRQRLALAQLLRVPTLVFVRRRQQAGEPVAESPELAALALAHRDLPPEQPAPVPQRRVAVQPVARPLPAATAALPEVLTASAVTALRECPYRFFARSVLRLDEPVELEAALAKREYGDWLHLVLHRFHTERAEGAAQGEAGGAPADEGDPGGDLDSDPDTARLARAAEAATLELGLDAAELLPFRASFEAFVPAYLAWLRAREASGWRFVAGEVPREAAPPALAPTRLAGRLDRIDRHDGPRPPDADDPDDPDAADGSGPLHEVLDYKTGTAAKFRSLVQEPLEDTQLAFYAALLADSGPLQAAYLALDGRDAPQRFEHPGVRASAEALVAGLGGELARLRAGAPLPALGEGSVCEVCEARGLCRRDHWAEPEAGVR
jgi:ATP-dependent helicase/nuclease subunit B